MAMTKKERAEFDAAMDKVKLLSALRWTAPVVRDLPPPKGSGETSGWDFWISANNAHQAWSCAATHGDGPTRKNSVSQNSRVLFSTELLALQALRHEVEIESANRLAKIDRSINDYKSRNAKE